MAPQIAHGLNEKEHIFIIGFNRLYSKKTSAFTRHCTFYDQLLLWFELYTWDKLGNKKIRRNKYKIMEKKAKSSFYFIYLNVEAKKLTVEDQN